MPKVVHHEQRREAIAHAVWRVIRRDGLSRASVRNVAAEAGLSMGSLRHYFTSQSDLLVFTMRLVIDRVRQRALSLEREGHDPRWQAEHVLAELLPLDAERRTEAEVWLAFLGQVLVDPTLRELHDEQHDEVRTVCREFISALVDAGNARPGLDVEMETERLYALVDGLTMHVILRPDAVSPEQAMHVFRRHLDDLLH